VKREPKQYAAIRIGPPAGVSNNFDEEQQSQVGRAIRRCSSCRTRSRAQLTMQLASVTRRTIGTAADPGEEIAREARIQIVARWIITTNDKSCSGDVKAITGRNP
jgi:hypothetical protein